MKKEQNDLSQDVQELLKSSVIEEAVAKVKKQFDAAWAQLDAESQELLGRYFDGETVKELSAERGVPEDQMASWLARKKRELVQSLRNTNQVRQ